MCFICCAFLFIDNVVLWHFTAFQWCFYLHCDIVRSLISIPLCVCYLWRDWPIKTWTFSPTPQHQSYFLSSRPQVQSQWLRPSLREWHGWWWGAAGLESVSHISDGKRHRVRVKWQSEVTDWTVGQVGGERGWGKGHHAVGRGTDGGANEREKPGKREQWSWTGNETGKVCVHARLRVHTSGCPCWWHTWCGCRYSCTFRGLLNSLWRQTPASSGPQTHTVGHICHTNIEEWHGPIGDCTSENGFNVWVKFFFTMNAFCEQHMVYCKYIVDLQVKFKWLRMQGLGIQLFYKYLHFSTHRHR